MSSIDKKSLSRADKYQKQVRKRRNVTLQLCSMCSMSICSVEKYSVLFSRTFLLECTKKKKKRTNDCNKTKRGNVIFHFKPLADELRTCFDTLHIFFSCISDC